MCRPRQAYDRDLTREIHLQLSETHAGRIKKVDATGVTRPAPS
jgi:hypothetical protein